MASKQIKARKVSAARGTSGRAHTLWLAGLGAVSLTQKQAYKAYAGLVAEGRSLQHRARLSATKFYGEAQERIHSAVQPLSQKAAQVATQANKQVEANIASVLTRLGISKKPASKSATKAPTKRGAKRLKLAK